MEFGFSKEQEAILAQVDEFIAREMTPELLEETLHLEGIYGGEQARKFITKLASHGWLTPNWPKEYGGMGESEMIAYMIRDRLSRSGAPCFFTGANMAGPTILRFGSEEMKKRFLLPIARGELEFALGYTEPGAGSDLMSLTTFAQDKGDHFLVNGQKIFNTGCHICEYYWLAARTDKELPKHRGISMMIVDLKTPGIDLSPLYTMAGSRTNVVYLDNVKVPKENLVGEINMGASYLMAALDFERMFPFGDYHRLFETVVEYAKNTVVNGRPLSKDPEVRQTLAQLATELEAAKLLYFQLPAILHKGAVPNYQASMEKLFVSEMMQRIAKTAVDIVGPYGLLAADDEQTPVRGMLAHFIRQCNVETIYGGTSEIQRNIMALRGLGLPRA